MKISFKSKKLEKQLTNHKEMVKSFGQLAINVSGNYRIIFEPDHDPLPNKEDGGLSWEEVTKIQINEVAYYH